MKVWVVTRLQFEQGTSRSIGRRRRDEVMRLPGDTPAAEVAAIMERHYAEPDEGARPGPDGEIWVGHEPGFRARLVEDESQKISEVREEDLRRLFGLD
jgi:hypothetical protein